MVNRYNLQRLNLPGMQAYSGSAFDHDVEGSINAEVHSHPFNYINFEHEVTGEIHTRFGILVAGNLQRYNLAKYNLPGIHTQTVDFTHDAFGVFTALAGARIYMNFLHHVNGEIHNEAVLNLQTSFEHLLDGYIHSHVVPHVHLILAHEVEGNLTALVGMGKDLNLAHSVGGEFKHDVYVGKVMNVVDLENSGNFNSRVHVSKVMNVRHTVLGDIEAFVSMGLSRYAQFVINVTIPPGGEIRIDSLTFRVTRGIEDIFWAFQGEWVFLNRDTIQINLAAQSGTRVDGEVIYDARFI